MPNSIETAEMKKKIKLCAARNVAQYVGKPASGQGPDKVNLEYDILEVFGS